MSRKFVDSHFLGNDLIKVYIDPTLDGAEAHVAGKWTQGTVDAPFFVIGLGNLTCWCQVLDRLLHESNEYWLSRQNCRFVPDLRATGDVNNCLFALDHIKFTQLNAAVAEFVSEIAHALYKAYKESKKKKVKKKKPVDKIQECAT